MSRFLLLLSLSCILLVNLRVSTGSPVQEALPALVLDDAQETSSAPSFSPAPPGEASAPDATASTAGPEQTKATREPSAAPETAKGTDAPVQEAKLIPYEVKAGPAQTAGGEPVGTTSTTSVEQAANSSPSAGAQETTSERVSTVRPAEASEAAAPSSKDISVLLANKNDSENDLASPASADQQPAGSSVVVVEDKKQSPGVDLDSPVDTEPANPDTDRFHYSLGSTTDIRGSDEPKPTLVSSSSAQAPPAIANEASEKPALEAKAEQPVRQPEVEKAAEEAPKPSEAAALPARPTSVEAEESSEEPVEAKKEVEKVKPEEPVSSSEAKKSGAPAVSEEVKPDGEQQSSEASPTSSTTPTTTTTDSPTVSSSTTLAPQSTELAPKADTARADEPKREEPKQEASKTAITTTSSTTTSTSTTAKPARAAGEKPASVSSVLAVALGTALGAAVNPILAGKDKGLPAASPSSTTSTTSTTKAPSSSTRKSTTDRWDSWTPSSTASPTGAGSHNRRRPILPSIRRRFRPYSRFSPFPWGGVDSYSPGGEAEFAPIEPAPAARPTSTTGKPKRRAPSGVSSEAPKATSSTSAPALDDGEAEDKDISSSRRRVPERGVGSSGKRRHHHHHHHQRGDSDLSGRRRHHHHHHSHRPYGGERDEQPVSSYGSLGDFELPFSSSFGDHQPRPPFANGFSLFNSGPTGSAFDLLNPFGGWLDELSKPRPAQRPPSSLGSSANPGRPAGHRPSVGDSDVYNDESHSTDHRPYRPSVGSGSSYGNGHGGRQNGRDDYGHEHGLEHGHEHGHEHEHGHGHGHNHEHDHHHDCHDHDYDNHHDHYQGSRRPNRPRGGSESSVRPTESEHERPATGGPRRGGGGATSERPSRPHARGDWTQGADSATSLYSASSPPVAGRRVSPIFSPFDSLFSAIDDELFGLRSSLSDGPHKPESVHTLDAVVSSPKISMPSVDALTSAKSDAPNSIGGSSGNKETENDKVPVVANAGADVMRRTRSFG